MKHANRLLAALTIVCAAQGAAAQSVAFSTFGPDNNNATYGYNPGAGWTVSGASAFGLGEHDVANQFVASATGILSDIQFPLGQVGGTGYCQIQLLSDADGSVGNVLGTWASTSTFSFPGWGYPGGAGGGPSIQINSGTSYWIEFSGQNPSSDIDMIWNYNDQGATGLAATDTGGGWSYHSGSTLGAFKVTVTPNPEPASVICLAVGAVCIGRRRKIRARISEK